MDLSYLPADQRDYFEMILFQSGNSELLNATSLDKALSLAGNDEFMNLCRHSRNKKEYVRIASKMSSSQVEECIVYSLGTCNHMVGYRNSRYCRIR